MFNALVFGSNQDWILSNAFDTAMGWFVFVSSFGLAEHYSWDMGQNSFMLV